MKPSTISQLQKELATLEPKKVLEVCIRLVKYKKDNKELLSYLLFDAIDEDRYIENVKGEIDRLFDEINRMSAYTTKKGLQKTVRNMNKFIRYSDELKTELEIRLYFCRKVKTKRIDLDLSAVISNLFYREIEKIKVVFLKLHEDLRFDYTQELEGLGITI
jgi:hypothetical protein